MGGPAAKPQVPRSVYFESANATHEGEERPMNTLPTKKPSDTDVNNIPTWRELAERFVNLLKDFIKVVKELEREFEPKLLPVLKRLELELEQTLANVET